MVIGAGVVEEFYGCLDVGGSITCARSTYNVGQLVMPDRRVGEGPPSDKHTSAHSAPGGGGRTAFRTDIHLVSSSSKQGRYVEKGQVYFEFGKGRY